MIAARSADWKDYSSPASRSADWKDHYSSMEQEMEINTVSQARRDAGLPDPDSEPVVKPTIKKLPPIVQEALDRGRAKNEEEDDDDDDEEEVVSPQHDETRTRIISKKDARILLAVREMIENQVQREEYYRRGRTITVVDSNKFRITADSIEDYISRALQNSEGGMHLNDIITAIERLGWRTTSVHHKYAEVYRAIRKHYYMFEKMGKAKFRLRGAFARRPLDRTPLNTSTDPNKERLVSIKDIARGVVAKFYTAPGLSPSIVWAIMRHQGCDCSYSAVRKALQDNSTFVRNGFLHGLASTNVEKKSAQKSKSV